MLGLRTNFDEELSWLRQQLLEMGSSADRMVALAMRALQERSEPLAEDVIEADDVIDDFDLRIEASCMRLITQQQPVSRDLRLIGTAMKVITDLERIADHAVDIAKVARKLARGTVSEPLVDLPRLAAAVRSMLRDAMTAFIHHDLQLVNGVVRADDTVDELFHRQRDELHDVMRSRPELVVTASYLLFVAHYLERIADHTVNIAERVHFVETGHYVPLARRLKTDPPAPSSAAS